jgi:CheY-like chemotaxis protein
MDRQPRILIVDDDTDFVAATKKILEGNDYVVEASPSTREARRRIEANRPDLILLDVMMERMNDGFTFCHELKHHQEYRRIPIIIISSITEKTGLKFSPETDGEYLEAQAFLDKPVKAAELLGTIGELLKP